MNDAKRWITVVMVASSLAVSACGRNHAVHKAEHPAEIVKIEGSNLSRVTLTAKAVERLDLRTDEVRELRVAGSDTPRRVVPYSALIYDPQGVTWVYTSPEPRTFVRHKVEVDHIEGSTVVLKDGPPAGTVVASVAVAELYGAEFKVGH